MATSKEILQTIRDEMKAKGYPLETQALLLGQMKKEMQFLPKYLSENISKSAADDAYDNRMGNQTGEGYKYRGRGYIQITGKNNYRRIGEELFLDGVIDDPDALVTNPDLLLDPKLAAKASLKYIELEPSFQKALKDGDFKQQSIALTKVINPGLFKKQKDFYLPENTQKNVLLNEGKDIRHNKGKGISYQEDIDRRNKYAEDFRKQLLIEQAGIPITVDGDFGRQSQGAWELFKKTPELKTSDQQIPYPVTPEITPTRLTPQQMEQAVKPTAQFDSMKDLLRSIGEKVSSVIPSAQAEELPVRGQPTYDYIPQQAEPQYATMEDLLMDKGLMQNPLLFDDKTAEQMWRQF